MTFSILDPQTSITMISSSSSQDHRSTQLMIIPSPTLAPTPLLTDTTIQQTPSSQLFSVDSLIVPVTSLPFPPTQSSTRYSLAVTMGPKRMTDESTGLVVGLVFLFLILIVLVTIFVLLLIIYVRKRNDKKHQGKPYIVLSLFFKFYSGSMYRSSRSYKTLVYSSKSYSTCIIISRRFDFQLAWRKWTIWNR